MNKAKSFFQRIALRSKALALLTIFVTTFICCYVGSSTVYAATNVDTFSELQSACQSSGTVQITAKIAVTGTITVPKGVTVYLTCSHDAGSTTTDIYRAQGFHGHLFKVNDGATLYVRCAIDGNNKDGNGNLRGTGATGTEGDGYYGQSLILNYGNVIMDNDKSVLKNNYNAYNNDYKAGLLWTYNSKKYYGLSASPESTSLSGSAVLCVNGKFTMSNGQIYGCYADNGPALYVCNGYAADLVKVSGGKIHDNVARRYGGAIFAASRKPYSSYSDSSSFVGSRTLNSTGSNALVTVSGGSIYNNLARLNSGAVWVGFGGTFYMSGGSIYKNVAVEEGGGGIRVNAGGAGTTGGWMCFANPGGQTWIAGGSIYSNTCATNGGGITVANNDDANNLLKITGGNIYSNTAGSNGGGVYCASKLNYSAGNIYKNTASGNGGGVYLTADGVLTMSGGSVHTNTASGHGGGVYLTTDGSACTISGGNIYSNTAEYGGGVSSLRTAGLTLSNVKVYNNTASATGGGVRSTGKLTINSGFYYGNTNIGVYVAGGSAAINGGKFGVSEYTDYSTYTVSRNTASQITTAAGTSVTINTSGYPRIVSTLLSGETVGANKGIVNNGTLTISDASTNSFDLYGTGTSIYNTGTLNINGAVHIISSSKDGASKVQNRLGINNSASGTVNINSSNTKIAYCGSRGILNYGILNLKAGEIHHCSSPDVTTDNGGGILNNGDSSKFTMSGGKIYNNSANHGAGIYFTTAGNASTISGGEIYSNKATGSGGAFLSYRTNGVTISGGSIYNNTAGKYGGGVYVGAAPLTMTGGSIYGNSASTDKGDGIFVGTDSVFKMYKTALINTNNDVFLQTYTYITVPEKFTGTQTVRALVKGDNFKLGRVIAKYGSSTSAAGSNALYWDASAPDMAKQYFAIEMSGKVLRSGDQGAATNNSSINNQDVFISEKYTVSFDMNPASHMMSGTIVHTVGSQKYTFSDLSSNHINKDLYSKYWYENLSFNIGSVSTSTNISFVNWNTNSAGTGTTHKANETIVLAVSKNENIVLYAIWDLIIDIDYNGNGATEGENWTVSSVNSNAAYKLSDNKNAFVRNEGTRLFTFTGWSFTANSKSAQYGFGASVPPSVLQSYSSNVTGRDRAVVTAYATWDEYPTIEAVDRWFTLDDVKNGKITFEELISSATATDGVVGDVTDFEGGNLSGKEVFTIIDFDENDFKNFTTSGTVTITYKAVDKVGNEVYKTITIHIVDKDYQGGSFIKLFVRYISSIFFKDAEGNYVPESDGGLNVNSIWITNKDYNDALSKALGNTKNKETGEWDFVYLSISFSKDKVTEVKEYIDIHGLGTCLEDEALMEFYDLYLKP